MTRYRKRPVVVGAFQITREAVYKKSTWPNWVRGAWEDSVPAAGWWGYWIINDNGHISIRSPEDFAAEFEPVEEG